MYMHSGTTDFLKLASVLIFIAVAVWWLSDAIGTDYTVLVIFALVGVILFAGGALLSMAIQRNTLNAVAKFNVDDAQIDKYRMQAFKQMTSGQAALDRAAAQLTVLDAKRVTKLADQQAKLLTDTERQRIEQQQQSDVWTWGTDDQTADFQEWR